MAWNLQWWAYTIVALTVFFAFLLLNYIVNKINEAHLENRLMVLQERSPEGQVTQVQENILAVKKVQLTTSDKKLSIVQPSSVAEIKGVKEKEIKIEESEHSPFFLGSIYTNTDYAVSNKIEVIELVDVAESAQLGIPGKEETEHNPICTANEDISKVNDSIHLNNTEGKTDSIVDEQKSQTLKIPAGSESV